MSPSLTTLEGVRERGSPVLPPRLTPAPPFERRGVLGEDSMWIQEPGSVRSSVEAFARLISMVLVYFGQRRSPGTRERLDAMLVSYQELIAGLTLPVVGRALADYAAAHLAADALVLAVVGGSHHSLGGAEAALFSEATARSLDDPAVRLRESAEALRSATERAHAAAGLSDPIVDRELGQLAFDLGVAATRVVLAPPAPLSTRPPPPVPADGEEECDATAS